MTSTRLHRLLAASLILSVLLNGCKEAEPPSPKAPAAAGEDSDFIVENGVRVNLAGYPIVNKAITLKTVIVTSNTGDYNQASFFQKLEQITGIHLDIRQISVDHWEKLNLMFTSRQYPDLMLRSDASPYQMAAAQSAGDIVPFSDLLKYAPNWRKVFADNPAAQRAMTAKDGKIYSLGLIQENDVYLGIRDQWLINKLWLDQLGLEVPKTAEEFAHALAAFKANAGKGAIPDNAIPYYFRWDQYVGGQLDLFGGSFGILVPDENYIVVEDGKVRFQAMNPQIRKPLAFLQRLYREGLIPPEAFTDDWGAYYGKLVGHPEMVGSIAAYSNPNPSVYVPMLPPRAEGVSRQLYRRQTVFVRNNQFTVFSGNKYPVASARLADLLADPDWAVQEMHGLFGEGTRKNPDGTYDILKEPDPGGAYPGVDGIAAMNADLAAKLHFQPGNIHYNRSLAVNLYKPLVAPLDQFYPNYVTYSLEDQDKLTQLQMNIKAYVKQTFMRWIVNGGMEQEWDAYVAKLAAMGANDMLAILQKGLDDFNAL